MVIFIDESGIHKKIDYSTFVLIYIEVNDIDLINKKIVEIEEKLIKRPFHWKEHSWKIKGKFLKEILKLDFKAKIAVIKNPVNPSLELESSLIHMIIEKNLTNIYIDGKKPAWYEKKLKKVLRDKGITVKKLKLVKDTQYPGIRLADAIAGLSRWHFDKKNLERIGEYYERLRKKIVVILET